MLEMKKDLAQLNS